MKTKKWIVVVGLGVALAVGGTAQGAAKTEVVFNGEFVGIAGALPGPPAQVCVQRAGSCPAGFFESCGVAVGQSDVTGLFQADTFICINPATGQIRDAYYEIIAVDGSGTLFGPFQVDNVPAFGAGPAPVGFVGFGEWAVDGGTGRYAGATSNINPARTYQEAGESNTVVYLGGKIEIERDRD